MFIYQKRWIFIVFFIILILVALVFKLFLINTVEHNFLALEGKKRIERIVKETPLRGTITDRNGYPLAVSTLVYSVWVNPLNINLSGEKFKAVMRLLELRKETRVKVINRIKKRLGRSGFVYLKRQVDPFISSKISEMKVKGVHLKREYKRYYPDGEIISHIIGFVGIDHQGKEGVELSYNNWLKSSTGFKKVWKDGKGNKVKQIKSDTDPKYGNNLKLSIHRTIQYIAYKALKRGVLDNKAKAGSAIVMDINSGEVLAMVNQPSYNPNDLANSSISSRRNRAITDVFEPGSVIKTFAAIAAIKSGKFSQSSVIDTSPGYFYIGNNVIRDSRNYGEIDLGYILLKSSNVGISKAILSLPPDDLPMILNDFGFGSKTGIEFPGERSGYLPLEQNMDDFSLATLSFGYGMNLTVLQLSKAYATIANNGKQVEPTLLINNSIKSERRLMSEEVSKEIIAMLQRVVEGKDSRSKAKTWGYHVAGKTGTVHKASKGGYSKSDYIALFAGIAPVTNPRLVVVVMIDDPEGEYYYGGSVSAPVFSEIMSRSLRVLEVPFDKKK